MQNSFLFHQEIFRLVENYTKICNAEPENPENWQLLGRFLVDAERFDEAERALEIFFEKGRFFSLKNGIPRLRIRALRHYRRNRILFAKAYADLGAAALNNGDLAGAQRMELLAMREFEREKLDAEYIRAAHCLGTLYRISGNFDNATEVFRATQKIAHDNGWIFQEAAATGHLGLVAFAMEKFAESEHLHELAATLYEQNAYPQEAAWQLRSAGVAASCLNQHDDAFAKLSKALNTFEKNGNHIYRARVLSDLALAHLVCGNTEKALDAAQQALNAALLSENGAQIAESRFELARLMTNSEHTDTVTDLLTQSGAYYEKNGQKIALADVKSVLGLHYLNRGALNRAEVSFKDALRLDESSCRPFGTATDYANLGLVYEKKGETERAVSCYRKARFLFDENGSAPLTSDMDKKLSELCQGCADNSVPSETVGCKS